MYEESSALKEQNVANVIFDRQWTLSYQGSESIA